MPEINLPKDGYDVKNYDKEQTEVINEHDAEISNLKKNINELNDYEIDRGSNSRGEWIKYKSGKLIQKGTFIATNGTEHLLNGVYRSSSTQTVTFPIPFIGTPDITTLIPQINSAFGAMVNDRSNTLFSMRLIHYVSQNVPTEVYYEAEGRWK